jgi:hypothetical protein
MHEEWRRNKYGGLFKVTNDYMNQKIRKNNEPKINEQEMKFGDYSLCAMWINDKDGNPVASVKYLKLNDMKKREVYKRMFGGKRIAIQMVEVNENERRKGYATKLLKNLQSKYPKEEIRFGQLEPDGEKLLNSIANITDSELLEGHKRRTYYGTIK